MPTSPTRLHESFLTMRDGGSRELVRPAGGNYLHDRLIQDPSLQPAWCAIHAAHRREELQHLVTDREVIRSLHVTLEDQHVYTRFHRHFMLQKFRFYIGIDAPLTLLRELFPDLPPIDLLVGGTVEDVRFFEVVRTHPAFSQTRALPGFFS